MQRAASELRAFMKRKSGKSMLDIDKKVKVVHFNVSSGYVSYLEEEDDEGRPKVKGILIEKGRQGAKKVSGSK